MKDSLGNRMKGYEALAEKHLMPNLPICIRIDGKTFSKWTRGLHRPFDTNLQTTMQATTMDLVREMNAVVGYTQSDEISLIIHSDNHLAEMPFSGRVQKLASILASMTTAYFTKNVYLYMEPPYTEKIATFDCRVWQVPNKMEAVNVLRWREMDAVKNSISMAARSVYSHKDLMNKNGSEMQEMLFQKGINWNHYPTHFKRGLYSKRYRVDITSPEYLIKQLSLSNQERIKKDPTMYRTIVANLDIPRLNAISNPIEVLFHGDAPQLMDSKEA